MGLFWSIELNTDNIGSVDAKQNIMNILMNILTMYILTKHNSIKPRKDAELFLLAKKK